MKITALVENKSDGELKAKHGLSQYIETSSRKILFDVGPDNTLFQNAAARGIDLSQIDTVVISHGHIDHGGALKRFLQINSTARIYIQKQAFEPHYSKLLCFRWNIGLDAMLEQHPQVVVVCGDYQIDDKLQLFTVDQPDRFYSSANDVLYDANGKDRFLHEQNLMIREGEGVLVMGCGHAGIINILEKAKASGYAPGVCVGGYHLFDPITRQTVSTALLDALAKELKKYSEIEFYTCHCTGTKAFRYLSKKVPKLHYLSCGETIETEP